MRKITLVACLQLLWLIAPAQERQWFSEDEIAGLNPPPEFTARTNAVSFVIGDTAYVGTGDMGSTTTDFWKYVPATNTWTAISEFPGTRRKGAVAFTIGNKGYVGSGEGRDGYFKDFWKYDPAKDEWSPIEDFAGEARTNAVAFTINNVAYVGSGKTELLDYTNDFWKYDPDADAWTSVAALPNLARSEAFAFTANGLGYVGGGLRSGTNVEIDLYSYNPTTNEWQEKGERRNPFRREKGVAFVLDGQAFIGLGFGKDDFVIYDIANNTTTDALGPEDEFGLSDETYRFRSVAFVVRGKAFVGLGGTNTASYQKDLWSFQSPVPDTPKNLTVVTATQTSATMRWTDYANNEDDFRIERSTDGIAFTPAGTTPANITQYEDNDLPIDGEYFYRVRANCTPNNSLYSDTVVVNTFTSPSGLSADVASPTEITLNWQDNSTGEVGFAIKRATDGGPFVAIDTVTANVTTFSDTNVNPGIDYSYRVYAIATVTASPTSNTVTAGSLVTPTDPSVVAVGGSFITINWTYPGSNAAWYLIERRSEETDFVLLDSVAASTATQFQDNTVDEATTYEYRIKAKDHPRSSAYSELLSVNSQLEAPAAVVATVQDSTVTVTWQDQSSQEIGYVIRRSIPNSPELLLLDSLSADTETYVDRSITRPGGDYHYHLQAVGNGLTSDSVRSNVVTVEFPEKTSPEEPDGEGSGDGEPGGKEPDGGETVTGIEEPVAENAVTVFPNPSPDQIQVNVGEERSAYVAVFDGQGRLVSETQQAEQTSGSIVTLDLEHVTPGVYTLRIYTAAGVVTKKVVKQ